MQDHAGHSLSALQQGANQRRTAGMLAAHVLALGMLASNSVLSAPGHDVDRWWAPASGRVFPESAVYADEQGELETLLQGGPMPTAGHPFFQPLGANGRACVTCHQPSDGMSLSAGTARERWDATGGRDPLFAAIDGSNCPDMPQAERASHSLLLDRGLIRVQRPWPPRGWDGKYIRPDFTLEAVRDPTGCNSGTLYGLKGRRPSVSVYRRPRAVANLKYVVAMGFAYDPKQGMPLRLDPESGKPVAGNLMADNRAPTLRAQMAEAGETHLEMISRLTESQKRQIEDLELRLFAAQVRGMQGTALDGNGAGGGPATLRDSKPGQLGSTGNAVWSREFGDWEHITDAQRATIPPAQLGYMESVARGARVFRERTFLISDSAGINSPMGFGNPVRNSCVFCHNMSQMGNDVAPGQVDLGTTTLPFSDPAPDLPLFRVTCRGKPHPHYGRVIYTSDPGLALTTGRCADVGKITLQSLRALAGRPPYFSNGSARTLRDIVDYYDRRYSIGYTEQEKQDLVNLMGAL